MKTKLIVLCVSVVTVLVLAVTAGATTYTQYRNCVMLMRGNASAPIACKYAGPETQWKCMNLAWIYGGMPFSLSWRPCLG